MCLASHNSFDLHNHHTPQHVQTLPNPPSEMRDDFWPPLMNDRKMQAEGLVPIVEPEILIDGEHGISKSAEVASRVLQGVIAKLLEKKVDLEACLLKIQMIMPGSEADAASSEEIAKATVDVISR
jgi:hypothetical protein